MKKKYIIIIAVLSLTLILILSLLLFLNKNKETTKDLTTTTKNIIKSKKYEYEDIHIYYTYEDGIQKIYNSQDKLLFTNEDPSLYIEPIDKYILLQEKLPIGVDYSPYRTIRKVYDYNGKIIKDNINIKYYVLDFDDYYVFEDSGVYYDSTTLYDSDFNKIMNINKIELGEETVLGIKNDYILVSGSIYDIKNKKYIATPTNSYDLVGDYLIIPNGKNKLLVIDTKNKKIDETYTSYECYENDGEEVSSNVYCKITKNKNNYYIVDNEIIKDKKKITNELYADYSKCKEGAKLYFNNKEIDKTCHDRYYQENDLIVIGDMANGDTSYYSQDLYINNKKITTTPVLIQIDDDDINKRYKITLTNDIDYSSIILHYSYDGKLLSKEQQEDMPYTYTTRQIECEDTCDYGDEDSVFNIETSTIYERVDKGNKTILKDVELARYTNYTDKTQPYGEVTYYYGSGKLYDKDFNEIIAINSLTYKSSIYIYKNYLFINNDSIYNIKTKKKISDKYNNLYFINDYFTFTFKDKNYIYDTIENKTISAVDKITCDSNPYLAEKAFYCKIEDNNETYYIDNNQKKILNKYELANNMYIDYSIGCPMLTDKNGKDISEDCHFYYKKITNDIVIGYMGLYGPYDLIYYKGKQLTKEPVTTTVSDNKIFINNFAGGPYYDFNGVYHEK